MLLLLSYSRHLYQLFLLPLLWLLLTILLKTKKLCVLIELIIDLHLSVVAHSLRLTALPLLHLQVSYLLVDVLQHL